jgi:hypothetical protein
MTKALAMLLFTLSVAMFSIGMYRYLMQFDAPTPRPYPPFEVPGIARVQRGEDLDSITDNAQDDFDNVVITFADTRDLCD